MIAAASSSDLFEISSIEAEAYHPELVTSLEGYQEIFARLEGDERLVVFRGPSSTVQGFCHFCLNQPAGDMCDVWDLAVAQKFQRTGVGRALLKHVIETATQNHMKFMHLYVPEDNLAARALYGFAGFQNIGRIENYYPPQGARSGDFTVDALMMELSLKR